VFSLRNHLILPSNAARRSMRTTDYENTRGTSGVLKVFYFIRFFHRLQGRSFCRLCIRFDAF
jgi:hypothetical protein